MVVVKMFHRDDKQEIVQDETDDDPHRGGRLFKILGNFGILSFNPSSYCSISSAANTFHWA